MKKLFIFPVMAILFFVVLFAVVEAYAQISDSFISVQTDKSSYSEGETILISGEVRDLYSGIPVSIIVLHPDGSIVSISQVTVGADKRFSTEVAAGGSLMDISGIYAIEVRYGAENRFASTSFEFNTSNSPCGPGTVYDPQSNSCVLEPIIPNICQDVWIPVCGVDGNTYSNSCYTDNVEIDYEGECRDAPELTDKDLQNFEKRIQKWNAMIGNFERNADKFESKGDFERAEYLLYKAEIYESLIEHLEKLIYE